MLSQQQYTWGVIAVSKSLVLGIEERDSNQETQKIHQAKSYGVKMAKKVVKRAKGEVWAKEQTGMGTNLAS